LKRSFIYYIFCLSLNLLSIAAFSQENSIRLIKGKVVDSNTLEPLEGASVELDFKDIGASTDKEGKFAIVVSTGKDYAIKISYIGYDPFRRRIHVDKEDIILDIELENVAQSLEEVIVSSAKMKEDIQTPSLGVTVLSLKGIKKLPTMMGEVDVLRSIQTLPGVSSVGEGANGLNIRGSQVDQNLIFIDETPIFNPTHMFGLFSVFASDAIRDLELYKGGVPARFGGRAATVMDIKMVDPSLNNFSLKGGIGPVSNRIMAEIPLIQDKLSILSAARLSYNDYLFRHFADPQFQNYRANFADIATKILYKPNNSNSITISNYISSDYYKVDSLFSLQNVVAKETKFNYGHNNYSFHWSHYFSPKLSSVLAMASTFYKTKTYAPDSINSIDLNSYIDYKNAHLSFDYIPNEKNVLNFGIMATRYDISPGKLNEFVKSRIGTVLLPNEYSYELAAYVDDEYRISKKFAFQLGLRYSQYYRIGPGETNYYLEGILPTEASLTKTEISEKGKIMSKYGGFEPRLTMRYAFDDETTLKMGYNRMRQYFQLVSNNTTPLPTSRYKTADSYVKPQIGDFVSLGFFKNFDSNIYEVSAETYYRNVQNTLDFISGANLQLNPYIETQFIGSKVKAYGLELMAQKKKGEVSGWVAYTYSRAFTRVVGNFPPITTINDGNWFPTNYDKPNTVNIFVNIGQGKHHSFSFNFAYNTGRPYSKPSGFYSINNVSYPVYEARNNARVRDYHRLDFSWTVSNASMKNKKWIGSWVVTIYNLYGRKNPYSLFFRSKGSTLSPYELSVFATPLVSLTYNFNFGKKDE
jgi:hypothetical protein